MKIIKILAIATPVVLIMLFIYSWLSLTVPSSPARTSATVFSGRVSGVYADEQSGDIVVRLQNDSGCIYYINHAVDSLSAHLPADILNRDISLSYYSGGVNIFGLRKSSRHICEIHYGKRLLYSEFAD